MKKMICISLLAMIPFMSIFADDKNENTAKDFIVKIFAGDVESALKLSGLPFSYDRRELIKKSDDLRKGFDKIVEQNGKQNVKGVSAREIKKTRGGHKDLKDDIIIYQVDFMIKKSPVSLQIFIRKSDGKVVGLYG